MSSSAQLLLAETTAGSSSFNAGFNFRATSGYVVDGANQVYVLSTDVYPTIRGGFTFGWVLNNNSVFGADRLNTNDVRLAGINYTSGFGGVTILSNTYFSVTLPASGTYATHLAIGDASFAQTNQRVEVRDGVTSTGLIVSAANVAINHFLDATGADLTNAAWPGSEAAVSKTFATTDFRLYAGDLTLTDVTTLAHLRIVG